MTRQEYIKKQAANYKVACDKRTRISDRYTSGNLTQSATQKLNAELNFLGMEIEQIEERIKFALGILLPEDARKEYRPSPYHTYKGIEFELKQTKFDR